MVSAAAEGVVQFRYWLLTSSCISASVAVMETSRMPNLWI